MNELLQLMHDTMSPVNAIKGAVTVLKTGTLSPEDTSKMLDIIGVKANQLNEVLDAYYVKCKDKTSLKSFLISITTNNEHGCWVADGDQGDPARTTVKASAKIYLGWNEAAKQMIQLKKEYPNREFMLEELN